MNETEQESTMKSHLVSYIVLCATLILILACGKNATAPSDMGTLRVSLTDATAAFEAVNVTFSEISAHIDTEWVEIRGKEKSPITVNLLEWNNGASIVLGEADVPAGHYTQIRLIIDTATVDIGGQTHDLKVPSGAKTGLKLGPEFTVEEGSTYELVIDFDAYRSVVTAGPRNNPTKYLLKPRIRVAPKALTGSISGAVKNFDKLPTAYALVGTDTVTSSPVKADSTFMLAFLEEGTYTVAVSDTSSGRSFSQKAVTVTRGSNNDIGTLSLQ
jgi:hypothetical protein